MLYTTTGHTIQRLLAGPVASSLVSFRQQIPFGDDTQPVHLTSTSGRRSAWPLFTWAVASRSNHSAGRDISRIDPLQPHLVWALPRGHFETTLRLQLTDVLGLTLWRSSRHESLEVIVYSQTTVLPSPVAPALRTAHAGPQSAPRREGEALDVRLYHAGDDVRRLHWALWAHSGQAWLRIPDHSPPPAGRKVWVLDVSVTSGLTPEQAERALDARLAPLSGWILASPSWLLIVPALGVTCREVSQLPTVLAKVRCHPLSSPPDLGWARNLSDTIVIVTGPDCPGARELKHALEPRHRVTWAVVPFPAMTARASRSWWARR